MPQLSLCIPTYSMGGMGAGFLAESFEILTRQSFTDFEVVVSDQSDDEAVAEVCASFSDRLQIRHIWNHEGKRQASGNVNNAMRQAEGDIIKILFQDDYLNGGDALKTIVEAIGITGKWHLCGSGVSRGGGAVERPMVPRLTSKLKFGKNTVSSPSVLAMRRELLEFFDEELIWLMDVDLYQRLWDRLGDPVISPETLVVNRVHAGQVSASVSPELRRHELRYMRSKRERPLAFGDWLEYCRQVLKAR
ncbi:glycosyltransferase [Pseudophaeobacter sp.]|uniref:glycosyltransferase family 2 protein n=1 Tax=Pseudophaeobacter sp. TaxID=1971739 RepID=UPI00329830CB